MTWRRPGRGGRDPGDRRDLLGTARARTDGRGRRRAGALTELTAADPGAELRQVAVIDSDGNTATHTGTDCIGRAGHSSATRSPVRRTSWFPSRLAGDARGLQRRARPARTAASGCTRRRRGRGRRLRGPSPPRCWSCPPAVAPWEQVLCCGSRMTPSHCWSSGGCSAFTTRTHRRRRPKGWTPQATTAPGAMFRAAGALAPDNHELRFWGALQPPRPAPRDRGRRARPAIAVRPAWREVLANVPASVAPAAPAVLDALRRG